MNFADQDETICALSTPGGIGALAVIRVSGKEAFAICDSIFSKSISNAKSHTLLYGKIADGEAEIDEVVVAVFRGPHSFTGEDTVEISCHGSVYIQQRLLQLLIRQGCRMANAGEYSMRAFLNGKMDLAQAEAIADLIASSSAVSHKLALEQMRGGFSRQIGNLREELITFASLIELELDFSEEDVEFANREQLEQLIHKLLKEVKVLMDSFATGNVLKNGVPVAIIGAPNMGKSTLLNALLKEDRAIVSEIAGTTRDTLEDEMVLGGVRFRFIDTAGIRETSDSIETMGIKRALEKAKQAAVVLFLVDARQEVSEIQQQIEDLRDKTGEAEVFCIANKADLLSADEKEDKLRALATLPNSFALSAALGDGIPALVEALVAQVQPNEDEVLITNIRHYEALAKTSESLQQVLAGMQQGISGDFLAIDIRRALHYLGEITGKIDVDRDILGTIFGRFCIGK